MLRNKFSAVLAGLFSLHIGGVASASGAELNPETAGKRLLNFGEWSNYCASKANDQTACMVRLLRPTERSGKGGDEFALSTINQNIVVTRSGVLLSPEINRKIVEVRADNGNRSTVTMKSGAQCTVFSAHSKSHLNLESTATYDAFVRFITDDSGASVTMLASTHIAGKQVFLFSQTNNGLIGAYFVDGQNNAGVWSACSIGEGASSLVAANEFFNLILGSARRY